MLQYTAFYTQILQNQPKKVNEKLKFLLILLTKNYTIAESRVLFGFKSHTIFAWNKK